MNPQDFKKLIKALDELTPGQVQDASLRITEVRRKTEAIAEIEARAQASGRCPHCQHEKREKWGAQGPISSDTDAVGADALSLGARGQAFKICTARISFWKRSRICPATGHRLRSASCLVVWGATNTRSGDGA
jgi:predicted Rdx family selenoprotein